MITKTVTSGQRSATATISEETRFIFSDAWSYFHVQNLGSGTVYISMSAGTAAGADGVIAIPAGGTACTMHGYPVNDVYVTSTASDMVQIIGANSATLPFKFGSTGGGGGGSYILPKASLNALGGIQAKAKTTENAEAAIGTDNKLYVKVPVALSELTNDAGFIKATADNLTNYYNKANSYSKVEINTLINDLNSLSAKIVAALPTENISATTIYLIQVPSTNNYNQYMYISNAWANLGTAQIDLTNYYTKAETDILLTGKANTSHTHTTVNGHTVESDVPANAKFTDTTYSAATTSADGLMSSADKAKLDGIAENANNYVLPTATSTILGGVKVDGTTITIVDGVISSTGGGGSITIDSALSASSENAVQNKIITAALGSKADTDHTQAANKGGTGQTSYTVGDILYANSASTLAKLAAGAADTVLTSNGTGTAPSWKAPTGSGGITQTLLYDGAVAKNNTYTLASAITNFKFLLLCFSTNSIDYQMYNILNTNTGNKYVYYWDTTAATFKTDYLTFTSATTFTSNNPNYYNFFKLWGVK